MNQIKKLKKYERERKRETTIDDDIDVGGFFELATSDKKGVDELNLNEIKTESLEEYTGCSELIGFNLIGEIEYKTKARF